MTFLNWLHELTALVYERGMVIPVEMVEVIKSIFNEGKSPLEAREILVSKHSEQLVELRHGE